MPKKLLISALDDDKNILIQYETYIENVIKKHNLNAEIVTITDNVNEFLNSVLNGKVNVCFLDIELGNKGKNTNGLLIGKTIREKLGMFSVEIIYITSYAQFMQSSFRVKPFNYIMKPADEKHFERELLRLQKTFLNDSWQFKEDDYIIIENKSLLYKFLKDEIVFLEFSGYRTVVNTIHTTASFDLPLNSLVKQLPTENFIQCHRSIYVNINYVMKVDYGESMISMKTGHRCLLSRKYKKNWRQMYAG